MAFYWENSTLAKILNTSIFHCNAYTTTSGTRASWPVLAAQQPATAAFKHATADYRTIIASAVTCYAWGAHSSGYASEASSPTRLGSLPRVQRTLSSKVIFPLLVLPLQIKSFYLYTVPNRGGLCASSVPVFMCAYTKSNKNIKDKKMMTFF